MMPSKELLVLLGLLSLSKGQDLSQYNCSLNLNKATLNLAGADVILGGLFSISEKGQNGYGCGKPISGNH